MCIRSVFTLAVLVTSLAGCDLFGILDESAPDDFSGQYIQTDQDVYEWDGSELAIPFAYENTFDRTVYIGVCTDGAGSTKIFEKRVNDEWKHAYSRICLAILGTPMAIEPGETYRDTLVLDEALIENNHWKASPVAGTYRMRDVMLWDWDQEEYVEGKLSSGTWYSEEFEIRKAE